MKKPTLVLLGMCMLLLLPLNSCKEDEGFHQISSVEREIYLKLNSHRSAEGLPTLVEQFLLFKEGRIISARLAAGEYQAGSPEANSAMEEITANLGGTSNALLSLAYPLENADSIANVLLNEAAALELIEGDFNQCGVGLTADSDQLFHIAILLMKIPD